MKIERKRLVKMKEFTPAEQRAARAARIEVGEADPYGWIAHSEMDGGGSYHLFCDPAAKRLVCTCADFIFRGDASPAYECKHISATLKYIGRRYLELDYDPRLRRQAA
jgi:hypothetical protein